MYGVHAIRAECVDIFLVQIRTKRVRGAREIFLLSLMFLFLFHLVEICFAHLELRRQIHVLSTSTGTIDGACADWKYFYFHRKFVQRRQLFRNTFGLVISFVGVLAVL